MSKPFLTEDGDFVTYKEYLLTAAWRKKRQEAFARCGNRCQLCGVPLYLYGRWHVHHNNYKNLGCEKPEDLIVLCKDCHGRFHRRKFNRGKMASKAAKEERVRIERLKVKSQSIEKRERIARGLANNATRYPSSFL